jgi:hypothetical protein
MKPRTGFDFSTADYRQACGGASCTRRTAADFKGFQATPAPAAFY